MSAGDTSSISGAKMLFSNKLELEIYPPWKDNYISYIRLKKLLKEGVILKNAWTEKDEQNFVSALDSDLEKVYTFQSDKYDELNEYLNELQAATESPTASFDVHSFSSKLELVLNLAQELNHFQRLNYTGFIKIVKKHDRLHPDYSVKPLLNVRLKSLPFHSEDYSPLLFKISALFQFLRDNYDVDQSLSKLSSFNDDAATADFQSFKFWVHPDNLMEVKATILRHLPVLVYNAAGESGAFNDEDDDDEDDEDDQFGFSRNDPTINCLYFDNDHFDLYNSKLAKSPNASTLRIKWIGKLYDKPKIYVEKKSFEKSSETYDVDEKFALKEKYLDSFISGNFDEEKYLRKLAKKGDSAVAIDEAKSHIDSLTKYIKDNHVQPCLRTTYKRTAFQIPGDEKVRVVIDSDIYFIREDSFDERRPIRDPAKWHRTDIDSKLNQPLSLLRKGEFVKFPYAELEIKVKTKKKKSVWIDELVHSHLVKEVPNFSKFVHGIASLFLEDDKLDSIPFWFNELESDLMIDPQQAYIDTKEKLAKLQNDEENLKKFKTMLSNSTHATTDYSARSKSFSGSILNSFEPSRLVDTEVDPKDTSIGLNTVTEIIENGAAASGGDLDQSSDEDYDEIEEESTNPLAKLLKFPNTFSKLLDVDSEDEEIVLPIGVAKPESYIKNAGPLKIEPKVWLANERTFNRWLHVTTLLSTLTFIIYSSTNKANSYELATFLAYMYFGLTLFSGVWGYYVFMSRRNIIMERSDKHLDKVVGPLIVALGLIGGLVVNFVYGFRALAQQQNGNFSTFGLGEDFLAKNPVHKSILEFVFKLVGA